MATGAYQSPVVRAWNAAAWLLPEKMGRRPLATDALLDKAIKATGCSDFWGDEFLEPLERFVRSLEETGSLHPFGRFYAKQIITGLLVNRLKLADSWKRHPEISEQRIDKPIFILGLPRSGTSFLFNMLARDPVHRVLTNWEATVAQVPPEGNYDFEHDPRRRIGRLAIRVQDHLAPDLRGIHPFHLDGPEECTPLLMQGFECQALAGAFDVPSYSEWLGDSANPATYRHHKRILQTLQWKYPGEKWVLKAPDHLRSVRAILESYPDACLIHMRRDPVECIPSWASLNRAFRGIHSRAANNERLGRLAMERLSRDLEGFEWERRRSDPAQFHDVEYQELVADPVGTVLRIYTRFELQATDEATEQVRFFVSRDRKTVRKHSYSAESFGLTAELIRSSLPPPPPPPSPALEALARA